MSVRWLVGLCSRVEDFFNNLTSCTDILCRYSWSPEENPAQIFVISWLVLTWSWHLRFRVKYCISTTAELSLIIEHWWISWIWTTHHVMEKHLLHCTCGIYFMGAAVFQKLKTKLLIHFLKITNSNTLCCHGRKLILERKNLVNKCWGTCFTFSQITLTEMLWFVIANANRIKAALWI